MTSSSRLIPLLLSGAVLLTGCYSATMIKSDPPGAKIYVNNEAVGITPYRYGDDKLAFSRTEIRIEKEDYEPFQTTLVRNEVIDGGALLAGLFVGIPLLWITKYKREHNYQLRPDKIPVQNQVAPVKSKADKLRELKALLDDNIITQEEFETAKKKILEE
jgi:hypothetical protein